MCEGGGLLQASPSTGGDILTAGGASERLGSEGGSPLETQPGDLAILSSMVAGRRSEAKSPETKRERRPRRGGGRLIPAAEAWVCCCGSAAAGLPLRVGGGERLACLPRKRSLKSGPPFCPSTVYLKMALAALLYLGL